MKEDFQPVKYPPTGAFAGRLKTAVGPKKGITLRYRRLRAQICHGVAPIPHLLRAQQFIISELLYDIHASIYPNSPRDSQETESMFPLLCGAYAHSTVDYGCAGAGSTA